MPQYFEFDMGYIGRESERERERERVVSHIQTNTLDLKPTG